MNVDSRSLRFALGSAALLFLAAPARADFLGVCLDGSIILIHETTGATQLLGVSTIAQLSSLAHHEPYGFVTYTNAPPFPPQLRRADPLLGQTHFQTRPFLNDVRAMAESNGVLYAVDAIGGGADNLLYWLDLTVPAGDSSIKHLIGSMHGTYIQGMSEGPNGSLLGWSTVYGLISIDPLDATFVDVNGVMDGSSVLQTLAWSPSGSLFGAYNQLYQVDPASGALTPIGAPWPYFVMGMEYWDPLSPTRFCDPKLNSLECGTYIDSSGTLSLSGPDDFHVLARNALSHRMGILLWSQTLQSVPFQGGSLCVSSPIARVPPQDSGGASSAIDCTGSYSYHFTNAYALSRGLGAGSQVHAQFYYRDPGQSDGTGVGLTDALRFTLLP